MRLVQRTLPPLLAAALLAGAVALRCGAADEEIDTTPAMAAAQSWLATVDAGRYAQSWEDAAKGFRDAVAREKWTPLVESARSQTGNLIARKVRSATYTRKLPNAPEGEYVVIVFDTRFERIPHAVETITPMREPDGTWKVSGYYVN
ncbi:MAG TPA: DUF4019 domain-containing protein [Usitatibacter sp.]|jgi:hypothetical protein|nr:DUF4019 domain-containing protein [Usitatibacter sp.]